MKILVLGSGAGGGFPQWNCNCRLCAGQRQGALHAQPRTQSSIAVSADGLDWALLNASPDLGHQLRSQPALHPRGRPRDTPIKAVVLMDSQIDHVTGLLSLREGPCLDIYATPCVFEDLTAGLPLLNVLHHYCGSRWHMLPVAGDQSEAEFTIDALPGLRFTALGIPGKASPYSPHRRDPVLGDNIALLVEDLADGTTLFYSPGLAEVGARELAWMRRADAVLVDGTFWQEDEMIAAGLSRKPAREMGHLPQQGEPGRPGMVDAMCAIDARRKVLIHINNSNPILDDGGAQRAALDALGIEVAYDGMEITL
jgi:pyrroloquinoline quinone biosynthesis protein B